MDEGLLGACGFYCGACPTWKDGRCAGCMAQHKAGDCYTRDCVLKKGLSFCGHCSGFPCDEILSRPKSTVLDRAWLLWKQKGKQEQQ